MDLKISKVRFEDETSDCSDKNKLRGRDYLSEYCDNTTIHGLKYIGEKETSFVEKLWWIGALALCLFYCYHLTKDTYEKWMLSPILIGFKQDPVPVWDIPFPAVTICPQTKSKQDLCNYTALYNAWMNKEELDPDDKERLAALSLICEQYGPLQTEPILNETVLDFLVQISPKLEDMKPRCGWRKNNTMPCDGLLTPVFTMEGVCYAFNVLDHKDFHTDLVARFRHFGTAPPVRGWSLESGYDHSRGTDVYPYRDLFLSRKTIEQSGLLVELGLHERDYDYLCKGSDQGFKVFVNHATETLRYGQQYFFAPVDRAVEIVVDPETMIASPELQSYTAEVRNCYYPDEKPLLFYRTYTKRNCEMECLANFTYGVLECVSFYMPRMEGWPICGSPNLRILDLIRDLSVAFKEAFNFNYKFDYMAILMEQDIDDMIQDLYVELMQRKAAKLAALTDESNGTVAFANATLYETNDDDKDDFKEYLLRNQTWQCDCRHSCVSVRYFGKKTAKMFNWMQAMQVSGKNMSDYEGMHFSKIVVVYSDNTVRTSERKALFGVSDFVGNVGGLLGLFTGFSFLSGFEILYYLTLRFWCNVTKYRKRC